MKKVILSILVGSTMVLASCGGSGYTTDQEAALEGYENMKEDATAHVESLMEIEKSWRADRDEILADYEGKSSYEKEGKLLEKAASDDDAKGDLEDLRNREFEYQSDMNDMSTEKWAKSWGINQSISDQRAMLKDDAKKSFVEKANKIGEDLGKIMSDHRKAVSDLDKD